MAIEDGFKVDELDEFTLKLIKLADKTMPKEINKFMKVEASKLNSRTKKRAKKEVKKNTGNYMKGFKKGKKVYEYEDVKYNIRVYNKSPHAHLLEYGHEIVKGGKHSNKGNKGGKNLGFVKGKFILENSSKEFENDFIKDTYDFVGNLLDKGLS
jgi:flagellar motor component MotA